MFDACPVHPKGTMAIPMLWRISEYVVCMMLVHAPAKESLRSPLPHIFPPPTRSRRGGLADRSQRKGSPWCISGRRAAGIRPGAPAANQLGGVRRVRRFEFRAE